MKRIKRLFPAIVFCVLLCGCSDKTENKIEENHIIKTGTENNGGYSLDSIQLDEDYIDRLLCIWDENIIYASSEYQGAVRTYYRYDMEENTTYRLGTMEYPRIGSGDLVAIDDKIYFYYNTAGSGSEDGHMESSLFQIDITENTLQKMADVPVDQTLIYLDAADGKVISYKGKNNGNEGMTYLDVLDASDKKDVKFDILIHKIYDREKAIGESIYNFSIYGSHIYLMVRTDNTDGGSVLTMEKYGLDGSYIGSWRVNDEIIGWLGGERISDFEIFGDFGFMTNFSGGGVVFRITSDELIPEFSKEMDLDIALPADNVNGDYAILFSRDTGEIYRLDISAGTLYQLDLPYERLNYIYMSNDNQILISSDTVLYGEIAQFPTKNGNLLSKL